MKVAEALREAAARLDATSDTARLDAEILLAHAMHTTRSRLLLDQIRDDAPPGFAKLIERRLAHEPVAYIIGEQEFYGRRFRVDRSVLIPRADSEAVVEAALVARSKPNRILDCGTGSGALLITLLAERPDATGIGIDRSAAALDIAARNAAALDLADRARWISADWTQPGWARGLGRFDLILANPPYVEETAVLDPDVRAWEPAGALFAGPDGLNDYREVVPQLPALLSSSGAAVLEIGASQAEPVSALAHAVGFAAQLRRDLAGRPRALVLELSRD